MGIGIWSRNKNIELIFELVGRDEKDGLVMFLFIKGGSKEIIF